MINIQMLPLGPLQTNCYLVICEQTKEVAIIDPAWDGERLLAIIADNGWTLCCILLTHTHFDHIGGLAAIQKETTAPIMAHEGAIPFLQAATMSAARWGIPLQQPDDPQQFIQEGDIVTVGKVDFEVIDTPGHAPGHVSFYAREHNVLFDGDVLFEGSIGRTDLPGGDYETLMTTIREKLLVLPDETHVLSGHGNPTTIGNERRTNPFLNDSLPQR